MATRPDRNCFLCGERNWCQHNPDPGPRVIVEQINPYAQARLDGIVAHRHGKPKSANPHGGTARTAWADGWRAADKGKVN
jgi:hypothetical protein